MTIMVRDTHKVFMAFFSFGLLNNILYVVILSAAIDLVGASTPKAVVLLADIVPSLTIKILAPFFIHMVPYQLRIWILVVLSSTGMLIVSLKNQNATLSKVFGIALASLSSGMGEVTFLQLTHFHYETHAIGGFSSGTGGAGILGSFLFMLLTNIVGMETWKALLTFAIAPIGFIGAYYFILPRNSTEATYRSLNDEDNFAEELALPETGVRREDDNPFESGKGSRGKQIYIHVRNTVKMITPLFRPYMIPLCTVYISEYVINQGVSPTLLFPLDEVPSWLIKTYRDTYVVYGFLYQLGVFISRSSVTFGIRVRKLYMLSILQAVNVGLTISQSVLDYPFPNIGILLLLIFYEGLLGGLLYVNTFMSVSEQVPKDRREFSMGCVGISDSFGVMVAGCINWWLETKLCNIQVGHGRDWCKVGDKTV